MEKKKKEKNHKLKDKTTSNYYTIYDEINDMVDCSYSFERVWSARKSSASFSDVPWIFSPFAFYLSYV